MNNPCFICELEAEDMFSIEAYEDLLTKGTGGYQGVCKRCYYLAIGYQSQHAGAIPVHEVRLLIRESPEAQFIKSATEILAREFGVRLETGRALRRLFGW